MPIRWTDTDPLGSFERTHTRDGKPSTIDVEAYRLTSMAPAFGLLLLVLITDSRLARRVSRFAAFTHAGGREKGGHGIVQ